MTDLPNRDRPVETMAETDIAAITVGAPRVVNGQITIVPYDPTWPEKYRREEAKIRAALPLNGTLVGRLLTEDQVEQRGLTRAVGAYEAEAVRARNEERDLGEEFAGTVGLGNVG